jgi:transposase-like protein
VPSELRLNTLALLGQHRVAEVLQVLGINHSMLSRWKRQYDVTASGAGVEAGFVALPTRAESRDSESLVEPPPLEAAQLRLTIRRDAQGLSLSGDMSLTQWRTALSLLELER